MDKAWLFYDEVEGYPIDVTTFICLDETDALETYMSLVEEEMFEAFYGITQDSLESIEQDWEERAQWMSPWWTMWCVMEVPIIMEIKTGNAKNGIPSFWTHIKSYI